MPAGTNVGEAFYEISARVDKLEKALAQGDARVKKSGDVAEKELSGRTSNSLGKVGGLFAGVAKQAAVLGVAGGLSLGGIGIAALKSAAQMESMSTAWEVMLGSSEAAQQRMNELRKFAATTPFDIPQVMQASRTLQVFGGTALATGENLRLVGDIAAGTQQPFQDVAMWIGRTYDAMKNGQPFGEAAMRLQEMGALSGAGRRQLEQLATQVKDGSMTMDQAWQGSMGIFGQFAGMMDKQSKTMSGQWSNLMDNMGQALAGIGETLLPMAKEIVASLNDVLPDIKEALVGAFTAAAPAIKAALGIIVQLIRISAQAFTAALQVAGPYLKIVGDVATGLAEHANVIIPLLAVAYGVKLVASLEGATLKTRLLEAATKSLRTAMLLGLPVLLDWAGAAAEGIGKLDKTPEQINEIQRAADALHISFNEMAGIMGSELWEASQKFGVSQSTLMMLLADSANRGKDWRAVLSDLKDGTLDNVMGSDQMAGALSRESQERGRAATMAKVHRDAVLGATADIDQALVSQLQGINKVIPESIHRVGNDISVGLEGIGVIVASDNNIAAAVANAVKRADAAAAEEAAKIPKSIADAIVGNISEIEQIGSRITEILEGSVSDGAALAKNAALLISPNVASALSGNSIEAKDAMLRDVVEPLIDSINLLQPEALKSGKGIPAGMRSGVQQTLGQAVDAVRDLRDKVAPGMDLEKFARQYGLDGIADYIAGMEVKRTAASRKAGEISSGVKKRMALDLWESGFHAGSSFAAGLDASGSVIGQAAKGAASQAGRYLKHSKPEAGPMAEGEQVWGRHAIENLAAGIYDAIPALARAATRAAQTAATALGGQPRGSAGMPTASSALAALGGPAMALRPAAVGAAAPAAQVNMQITYAPLLSTASPGDIERMRRVVTDAVLQSLTARGYVAQRPATS